MHTEWEDEKRRVPKYPRGQGPTALILRMAEEAPGGIVRWSEVEEAYCSASQAARRHRARGERNHCMWIKQVLDRHFVKVLGEGSRGLYALRRTIGNEEAGKPWRYLLDGQFYFVDDGADGWEVHPQTADGDALERELGAY